MNENIIQIWEHISQFVCWEFCRRMASKSCFIKTDLQEFLKDIVITMTTRDREASVLPHEIIAKSIEQANVIVNTELYEVQLLSLRIVSKLNSLLQQRIPDLKDSANSLEKILTDYVHSCSSDMSKSEKEKESSKVNLFIYEFCEKSFNYLPVPHLLQKEMELSNNSERKDLQEIQFSVEDLEEIRKNIEQDHLFEDIMAFVHNDSEKGSVKDVDTTKDSNTSINSESSPEVSSSNELIQDSQFSIENPNLQSVDMADLEKEKPGEHKKKSAMIIKSPETPKSTKNVESSSDSICGIPKRKSLELRQHYHLRHSSPNKKDRHRINKKTIRNIEIKNSKVKDASKKDMKTVHILSSNGVPNRSGGASDDRSFMKLRNSKAKMKNKSEQTNSSSSTVKNISKTASSKILQRNIRTRLSISSKENIFSSPVSDKSSSSKRSSSLSLLALPQKRVTSLPSAENSVSSQPASQKNISLPTRSFRRHILSTRLAKSKTRFVSQINKKSSSDSSSKRSATYSLRNIHKIEAIKQKKETSKSPTISPILNHYKFTRRSDSDQTSKGENIIKTRGKVAWTEKEEELLVKGIEFFGEGKWKKIRAHFGLHNRTDINISNKWKSIKNDGQLSKIKNRMR